MLDLGVEFRAGKRIDSLKALLGEAWDAVFVGSGAPRGRDLDVPGRNEAAANIHIGIDWLSSVSFGHITRDRQARRRAGRRQHRDGLLPQLAPAGRRERAGRRALRLRRDEGIAVGEGRRDARGHPDPQLPRAEGVHARRRQAHRRHVREGRAAASTPRDGAQLVPTGEPDGAHSLRRRAGRDRAGERVSRGSSATSASSSTSTACRWSTRRRWRRRAQACSSAATRRSARRTSSGRSRTATRRRSRSTCSAAARTSRERPPPHTNLISQKMGIHEWSYDNAIIERPPLPRAAQGHQDRAQEHQGRGRAGLRREAGVRRGAALPQLRRADGVQRQAVHRVRRLRRHLPDGLHHVHQQRRRDRPARAAAARRRGISRRICTSPARSRPAA